MDVGAGNDDDDGLILSVSLSHLILPVTTSSA